MKKRGRYTWSPLFLAAECGYPSVVRCLLEGGASADELEKGPESGDHLSDSKGYNEKYQSPLMVAAVEGHTEVVDLLLDFDQKIHRKDDRGWTAVHYAADEGHLETFKKLFERGAENSRTSRGWNGIHIAAQNGHDSCVEFFASRGTSLNALSNERDGARTALHVATIYDQKSTILALGRLGADLKIMDTAERMAYDHAIDLVEVKGALIAAEKAQTDRPRLWHMHYLATTAYYASSTVYQGLEEEVRSCIDGHTFNDSDTKYMTKLVRGELSAKRKQIDPRITDCLDRRLRSPWLGTLNDVLDEYDDYERVMKKGLLPIGF